MASRQKKQNEVFKVIGSRSVYLALVFDFPLVSIKSDEHLVAAGRVIDKLLQIEKLSEGQSLYLDALSDLVWCYEQSDDEL